jgi:site-specific DNA-methyltransferase (adenine-specific)
MTTPFFSYGQAELFSGDCLKWLTIQPEKSITAVVTDPPYGVDEYTAEQQAKLRAGKGGIWRIPPSFDGHTRSPLPRFTVMSRGDIEYQMDFFEAWGKAVRHALVPGGHVMLACNPLLSPYISTALSAASLERRGEIVRLVMTMRGGDRPKNAHHEFDDVTVMPRSQWEPWLLFRRPIEERTVADNLRKWKAGGLRRISKEKPFGDVIRSHPTGRAERQLASHPSLKPQAFLRQIVRASLPLGEGIIADPFAGSGSTLAAAEAVGYASVGVERDPVYLEVAKSAIPKLAQLRISDERSS